MCGSWSVAYLISAKQPKNAFNDQSRLGVVPELLHFEENAKEAS